LVHGCLLVLTPAFAERVLCNKNWRYQELWKSN
jgi:hypothetical protein